MNTKRKLIQICLLCVVLLQEVTSEAQTIQTICSFDSTNGAYPVAGLTLGNDGNFYGTTSQGGSTTNGTIFKVTPNGTLTTLVSFNGTNGISPQTFLTKGYDGNFYGTTSAGGLNSTVTGTFFQITPNGTLTTLGYFGNYPQIFLPSGLTLCNDGNFYGTSYGDGDNKAGSVFKVTTNGTITILASFSGNTVLPSGLTLGNDGNFYGTTYYGGKYALGTVFQVKTNGTLTTLFSFPGQQGACPPAAGLTLGSDSNFYGMTEGALMVLERPSR